MNQPETPDISFILPARNEAATIGPIVAGIREHHPVAEVVVVDDGSDDETAAQARQAGAKVISHPVSLGNGAAVKTGARAASGDVLLFMDADGQHDPKDAPALLKIIAEGYDMAVGARTTGSHANAGRLLANKAYNLVASIICGHGIPDLTSGFRACRAGLFRRFLYLLPNGFSYPTTITMAFLRAGFPVGFVPIKAAKRKGKSHIRPIRDGLRFLIIIFKIATLYSPLKVFVPISGLFFAFGIGYYLYTFFTMGRFTNMSLLLFSAAVLIFLIGLVSEQITQLMYRESG